jgi:hypothetical protein
MVTWKLTGQHPHLQGTRIGSCQFLQKIKVCQLAILTVMTHQSTAAYRHKTVRRLRADQREHLYLRDIDPQQIFEEQEGLCPICGRPLDEYQLDHIFPLCLGALHMPFNVRAIHPHCHAKKSRQEAGLIRRVKAEQQVEVIARRQLRQAAQQYWLEEIESGLVL